MHRYKFIIFIILMYITATGNIQSQARDVFWAYNLDNDYKIETNIIYSSTDGYDCKLDVYARKKTNGLSPVVLCIHGGGWLIHSKEDAIGIMLPYLDMGLSVVNVEYRLAGVAPAPAAVEDCRMALRWVIKNAKEYGFDTDRIIVTGRSAGGHLALTTGIMDSSYGLDIPENPEYANIQPKAAAIINWFGITDVKDIISGSNGTKNAASYWLGAEMEDNARFSIEYMLKNMSLKCSPRFPRTKKEVESVARAVSPISYIRKDLPPVFTVHGDQDNYVPYEQAVKLHNALTKAGVPNRLMTIKGAGHHGGPYDKQFSREDMINIHAAIKEFLKKYRIIDIESDFYDLIFCRTKVSVDELYSRLIDRGYEAEGIHGSQQI